MNKKNNLVLTVEEMIMLKNSEEAKNKETYGNLFNAVKNFEKLTAYDIKDDPAFDELAKMALKLSKRVLMENIASEWHAQQLEDFKPEDNEHCQLCHTPNILIYYITNRLNDNVLHVGSSCINKFPRIDGTREMIKRRLGGSTEKSRKEILRRTELGKLLPDVLESVKKYRTEYEEFPILLPWNIYRGLDEAITDYLGVYTTYIKDGAMKDAPNIKENLEAKESDILAYIGKAREISAINQEKKTACKRSEIQYLKDRGAIELIEYISKHDGLYTKQSVQFIDNHGFIKEMEDVIINACGGSDLSLKLLSRDDRRLYFNLGSKNKRTKVEVYISYSEFMKLYGRQIFFDETYKLVLDPETFTINITSKNLNIIIDRINDVLKGIEEDIAFDYDDASSKVVYINRNADKTYKKINASLFLRNYASRMTLNNSEALRNAYLTDYRLLSRGGVWDKISDRKAFERMMRG